MNTRCKKYYTTCLLWGFFSVFEPYNSVLASAQPPDWQVLAVKILGQELLRPVGGIIISSPNLVLVPADFVTDEKPIYVLDGGFDVMLHGRPVKVEHIDRRLGFAIVSVEDLNKPQAPIRFTAPKAAEQLTLTGFNTPEQIVMGNPYFQERYKVKLVRVKDKHLPSIDGRLPDRAGSFIDDCGNLVGLSQASSTREGSVGSHTVVIWNQTILELLKAQKIKTKARQCRHP